jgi:hypothetical protein
MVMEIKKASSNEAKSRIADIGESNSGKSWSAVLQAKALSNGDMSKVLVIDTENRGHLYAKEFPGFNVLKVSHPFNPEKLVEILSDAEVRKFTVVIIDSISDFWDQTLQLHREISTSMKNTYYAWGKITPRWDALRSAVNNFPGHLISTCRTKDKLVQQGNEMVNTGPKAVTRGGNKGIKYDYQLVFLIDENHLSRVGKDNMNLFSEWKEPRLFMPADAEKIAKWFGAK